MYITNWLSNSYLYKREKKLMNELAVHVRCLRVEIKKKLCKNSIVSLTMTFILFAVETIKWREKKKQSYGNYNKSNSIETEQITSENVPNR